MKKTKITQAIYDNYKYHFDLQLDEKKESIYKNNIDELTCRMTRKKALGTWTEQDQKEYDEANLKCSNLINELIKQSDISNYEIISEAEYKKIIEEEEKQQQAEQTAPQIEAIADAKKENLKKAIAEAPAKKKTMAKNTK